VATRSVRLEWTGEGLAFRGAAPDGPEITLDSDGTAGPSPTQALLMSLAGCMGIDVVMILQKGRVPLDAISVAVEGDRAEEVPRRFTAMRLVYHIQGPGEEHRKKVERAVDLSRERYCSVLHTLRTDIDLDIQVELA
jgi:putative redox protein